MSSVNKCKIIVLENDFFFFQAEDGIRDIGVTGVQTCALPILVKFEFRVPPRSGEQVAVIEDLHKRYGPRVIYDGFNLTIRRSEERRVGKECRSRWSAYQ